MSEKISAILTPKTTQYHYYAKNSNYNWINSTKRTKVTSICPGSNLSISKLFYLYPAVNEEKGKVLPENCKMDQITKGKNNVI